MGTARLIRQKATLRQHWLPELKQWVKDGLDTPGIVLIRVEAQRIKHWQDGDEGELHVGAND